ncbi:MAG TPA: glycosyltransferase family 2 protein [Verrucomicrobiae bacterium]|nr:glycosyltransferase family 2 protein [Verrucomicrobiae bacterium]
MDWKSQCAAVIPALDEAGVIGPLIGEIRRYLPSVLIVDDGSQDNTAALAEGSGAEVIRHPETKGKGASLKAGWRRAKERGFSWVLCLDGDGQHAPADIPAFFAAAERTGAPLVIGNRMTDAQKMPPVRRWTNRWLSRRLSRAAGLELPDSQCGFRLMRLDAWEPLLLEAEHYDIESDQLLAFARAGHRVEFVPIQVIYRTERSKIHPVRDTLRWFRWWRRVGGSGKS